MRTAGGNCCNERDADEGIRLGTIGRLALPDWDSEGKVEGRQKGTKRKPEGKGNPARCGGERPEREGNGEA